jgi:Yip1 domain.
MFCKNCGQEINDDSKFCSYCGEYLQESGQPAEKGTALNPTVIRPSKAKALASALIKDLKNITGKFFTKNPASAITEASHSESQIWIVLIALNVLLFALVSCLNISQVIKYILDSLTNYIKSTASSTVGSSIAGSVVGNNLPQFQVPAFFELFLPLVLLAVITLAAEFVGIYIALKIERKKPGSYVNVANIVSVASIPLSIALIANLILGLIYPPATLFLFVAAILVNMVLLYEGLRNIVDCEKAPIIGFVIIAAFLCVIALIALNIGVHQIGKLLQNTLTNAIGGTLTDKLGSALGGLLG